MVRMASALRTPNPLGENGDATPRSWVYVVTAKISTPSDVMVSAACWKSREDSRAGSALAAACPCSGEEQPVPVPQTLAIRPKTAR